MPRYTFSIIVPTYNRADEIRDLLQSFNRLNFPKERFEVLIVDDGSTDETPQLIHSLAQQSDFSIRFFRRDHEGPGPARNFGMAQAGGEYFLFIDSDCIADVNWLSALAKAVDDEQPDAFGGPDAVLPEFTPLQKAINYSMTSFLTTGGMRGHSKKKLAKYYPRSFNMGVHRTIFEKLGGMGTLRHGQDLEYSRRIVASGAKVIPVPDAVVYHKRRSSLKKFFRQIFNWGVARINLTLIDKGILEPLHFIPAAAADGFLLLLLLSPLSPFIWKLWLVAACFALLILLFIFCDTLRQYKDLKTALLAPIVAMIQVFAYGFGFTTGFVRRIILKQESYTGFVKKYYK